MSRDCDREVYIHLVWATKRRELTLLPPLERAVHRIMHSEARKLGCRVVALNGTEDHVHVLVQLGPSVSLARVINQLKGVTALFMNDNRVSVDMPLFQWQDGYGAFSLATNQVRVVADYVNNQKAHHASNDLRERWEPHDQIESRNASIQSPKAASPTNTE